MRNFYTLTIFASLLTLCAVPTATAKRASDVDKLPLITISENQRFLQSEDGKPFFYLGDTAWELFHLLNNEEREYYLTTRAEQGFNVIQAAVLSPLDGATTPNRNGHLPFIDLDVTKPAIKEGESNDFWDDVDYIVNRANELGMYIGMLPTWGNYWFGPGGYFKDGDPLFDEDNARIYGKFLGERYKESGVIWVLGGDRPADTPKKRAIIRAMAEGIEASGAKQLITYHPSGGCSSTDLLNNEEWLDFNMRQNGHAANYNGKYGSTLDDYNITPRRPVIDSEPIYEDHPIAFNAAQEGYSTATDVRRTLYWDLFNGAFGHAYGHHSVWQMYDEARSTNPISDPFMSWREAMLQMGARQMVYGKMLMESRPFFSRIPDSSLIVASDIPNSVPGAGRYKFVATRDEDGSYAMIYVPNGRKFSVDTSSIRGEKLKVWWYNPRNGEAQSAGVMAKSATMEFVSPTEGEALDWILVLDDAAAKYPKPGKKL